MRRMFFAALCLMFIIGQPTDLQAQRGAKSASKVWKWIGKTIAAAAIEAVVQQEMRQVFYEAPYNRNQIQISVTNNYNSVIYLSMTYDGYNWYPCTLMPGYYINFNSSSQGIIAIFNGRQYYMVSKGGNYRASSFF